MTNSRVPGPGFRVPGDEMMTRRVPGATPESLRACRATGLLLLLLSCVAPVAADEPAWWHNAWPYRARIDCPAGPGDVAWASVALAGRTTEDGRDVRLFDAAGQPCPFEILHHDPRLATRLAFRVPPDEPSSVWLYCGNPRAPAIETARLPGISPSKAADIRAQWRRAQQQREAAVAQQRALDERLIRMQVEAQAARRLGQVPPSTLAEMQRTIQQAQQQLDELNRRIDGMPPPPQPGEVADPIRWPLRRGIMLRVYRKAQPGNPKSLAELKAAVARGALEGAGFRAGVSDGCNPFGTSDHYISFYSGYLRIDQPGEYAFCSASDDGSWIVVNGRTLLEWPGPHGWQGAGRGQRNGRISLPAGVAHVEYYHEEETGPQMAFLGWRPPGQDHFTAISREQWLAVREARTADYQARGKPLLAVPEVHIVNTWWVRDSDDQQAALIECRNRGSSAQGKIARCRWSFGDGLEATGQTVRHVYFRPYRPEIELTVTDERGNSDTVRCSPNIFTVDVLSQEFGYGNEAQYVRLASDYDASRMRREDLEAYADFWLHMEQQDQVARVVTAYLQRFADSPAAARLAAGAAEAYLSPKPYDPKRANDLLIQAIAGTKDAQTRRDLLSRRARVLTWDLGDCEAAGELYRQISPSSQPAGGLPNHVARSWLAGRGDVALLSGDPDRARELYRQAEQLAGRKPDDPETLAKEGIYPYAVEDFLARGEFEWARKTLDEWEQQLPSCKLDGYTLFLRGKVLFVEHPGDQALRYLALAEQVAPKAAFVPEAVWLHANCLMAVGRYEEALGELRRIRADFTRSEFFAQAAERIKQCEAKLNAATQPARP